MRINSKSPDRTGIKAKPAKARPNVGGVKAANAGNTNSGMAHKSISVPEGKSQAKNSSAPQANFGVTGKGDPSGKYGSNANVKGGKFH